MSRTLNILDGESVEEFDALTATMHSEFAPATETERLLVDMMIQHEWLMRRALRMQQLLDRSPGEFGPDPKRLKLVVRYYRTHERAYAQAKRQLETMRKATVASATSERRQWEQILKKMPPITKYVN